MIALLLLLLGCQAATVDLATRQPIDEPLPSLPVQDDLPRTEGRWVLRLVDGKLADLDGHIGLLPAGDIEFLVLNEVEGATVDDHGRDLRDEALALWIRGHGSAYHRLPQAARGPINGGVQEDWSVTLAPGLYEISETIRQESSGYLRVR